MQVNGNIAFMNYKTGRIFLMTTQCNWLETDELCVMLSEKITLMKGLILLLIIPAFAGCQFYAETTEPVLYLGGGKWTFTDYEIVTENNGYQMTFAS